MRYKDTQASGGIVGKCYVKRVKSIQTFIQFLETAIIEWNKVFIWICFQHAISFPSHFTKFRLKWLLLHGLEFPVMSEKALTC